MLDLQEIIYSAVISGAANEVVKTVKNVLGISLFKKLQDIKNNDNHLRDEIRTILKDEYMFNSLTQSLEHIYQQKNVKGDNIIGDKFSGDKIIGNQIIYPQDKKKLLKHIPATITTFTGRENDLAELHDSLEKKGTVLLLNGLGGIGKTTAAQEYAKRKYDYYDSIIWLDYEDSFKSSFVKLNEFLCIECKPEEVYQQIISELSVYTGNHLLIIDNFHNEDEITALKNLLTNFKKLITSREEIPYDFVKTQRLDELPPDEAVELFNTYYKKEYNPETLEKFLVLIGYHTLTIELTAKTLDRSMGRVTLEDIHRIFEDRKFDTKKGALKTDVDYKLQQMKINSFMEELFTLSDIPEEELSILRRFVILPPVEIEDTIIPDMFGIDADSQDNFIEKKENLIKSGWLIQTKKGIKCHRIIQLLILKNYPPNYENAQQLVSYITLQLYCEPGDNPLNKARWLPFAVSLMENLSEENNEIATLSNNLALRYKDLGDLKQALKWAEKSTEIRENIFTEDHPFLATSYNNLATIYKALGDLKQALDYKMKSVEIEERVLPRNHPQFGASYNNLAMIYQDLGDLKQALIWEEKSTEIRENILPEDHPSLATSYNNLALIYKALGDLKQALIWAKKSTEIREKILPEDHPSLATSYNNLALIYKDLGDLKQALIWAKKSTEIREKILPEDHPSLATSYNNLAMIYKALGDLKQALDYKLKSVEIEERVLPLNHPQFVLSYNNLASIYHAMGNTKKAKEYAEKARSVRSGESLNQD